MPTMVLDLRSRPAGYEVIRACLGVQRQTPPRGTLARLFGISPIRDTDASWFTGALGEIRVGQLLARLGPEWTVLHSIPTGDRGSDIDHLLIGPPGVFTINTKHHRRKKIWVSEHQLRVAGQKTDHLRNALHEAERATRILATPVTPLLVIVAAREITFRGSKVSRPDVLTDLNLLRDLKRRKHTLSPEQIKSIVDVAARPVTWSVRQSPAPEHALLQDFAALEAEEERARRIRLGWLGLAHVALAIAAGWVVLRVLPGALSQFLTH
jgi:hypothetical protein